MGNKGFEIDMSGLDKLRKKVEGLSGKNRIKLVKLFNEGFVRKNTNFSNVEEMFEKSGLEIKSGEDIKNNEKAWDEFIKANTKYDGWKTLLKAASAEWIKKELGL